MKLGTDWRDLGNIKVVLNNKYWYIIYVPGGYLVSAGDYTHDEDYHSDPIPKFFYSLRNGCIEHQDVEYFNRGLYKALWSDESYVHILS